MEEATAKDLTRDTGVQLKTALEKICVHAWVGTVVPPQAGIRDSCLRRGGKGREKTGGYIGEHVARRGPALREMSEHSRRRKER